MTTREIQLGNGGRLSSQAAQNIVRIASKHDASVMINVGAKSVNAKSLMGMVSLGEMRNVVRITADGRAEEPAIEAIAQAIRDALGVA